MKKDRIQAAKPVKAAIMALDTVISAEAERLGVDAKTIVIGIHRDDHITEIALAGCSCPACAERMALRLVRAMKHAHEKPDEDFGTIVDAAGSVH